MDRRKRENFDNDVAENALPLPFSPYITSFESILMNNYFVSTIFALLVYLPSMIVLLILFVIQLPLTVILNLVLKLLGKFDSHPALIKHMGNTENEQTLKRLFNKKARGPTSKEKELITVTQFNLFTYMGRFYNRYPLFTSILNKEKSDIICIQEAITSKYLPIGTLNTMKKMNGCNCNYDGFMTSLFECAPILHPLLFKNSYLRRMINECQILLNSLFTISTFGKYYWEIALRLNGIYMIFSFIFWMFTGVVFQFGNLIAFKHGQCLFNDLLVLTPGHRMCLRSLYVSPKKKKKIWVFCTHLTATTEGVADGKTTTSHIQISQAKKIVKWCQDSNKRVCQGDAIIVCGDFNASPDHPAYDIMKANGFKSAIFEKFGKELPTYPSGSWTLDLDSERKKIRPRTLDYVWYKGDISLADAKLVGKKECIQFMDHNGVKQKLHPSDHLGIWAKFSI